MEEACLAVLVNEDSPRVGQCSEASSPDEGVKIYLDLFGRLGNQTVDLAADRGKRWPWPRT